MNLSKCIVRFGLGAVILSAGQTRGAVSANLDIVHGYDIYYATIGLTADPEPETHHRIVSPDGSFWRRIGDMTDQQIMSPNQNLAEVIDRCTNGLWQLTLNVGHSNETAYAFSVAVSGVSSNLFGDITFLSPANNSVITNNPPEFIWSSTSQLPQINLSAYDDDRTISINRSQPSGTTNWTPDTVLAEGGNTFYPRYSSNDFSGITFTVPTNALDGSSLPDWNATGDVRTYAILKFAITNPPPPILYEAALDFTIQRSLHTGTTTFAAFPLLTGNDASLFVESPNGLCHGTTALASSYMFPSLSNAVAECEAGDWRLHFNYGTASNQTCTFSVDLGGLSTTQLPAVSISHPADGSSGLPGNIDFQWSGPAHFTSLVINADQSTFSLPAETTYWPDAPFLSPGPNVFRTIYTLDPHTGFTFSIPTNSSGTAIDAWSVNARLKTMAAVDFSVRTGTPPYFELIPEVSHGAFQVSCTLPTFPDIEFLLQSTSSLTNNSWQDIQYFSGTGAPLIYQPGSTNRAGFFRIIPLP